MPAQAQARPLVTGYDDWDTLGGGDPAARLPGAPPSGSEPLDALSRQVRLTAWVRGRVQGVGFRWWVRSAALELGLIGVAENLTDGRVKVIAEGHRDSCVALLLLLEAPGTPGHVIQVTHRWDQARGGLAGFVERLAPAVQVTSQALRNASPDLGRRQLDRIGLWWDHGGVTCARSARVLRFCVRDHSGHSVWRTSSNGEGSAWPCWRARSPHGFRDAPAAATST